MICLFEDIFVQYILLLTQITEEIVDSMLCDPDKYFNVKTALKDEVKSSKNKF